MTATPITQAALWNGTAGNSWVDLRDLLDEMFRPIETLLADGIGASQRVLDVGCGTGSTTLAAARRGADATGVDLSAQMIDAARATAARLGLGATFVCADAQQHAFAPAGFDAVISRFGVMFFGDPVAAFRNLRQAARPGARLDMFVWRDAADNPYMTAAEKATAPLLPQLPPRQPDGPGQFALARPERVRGILAQAGWQAVTLEPADVPCSYPAAGAQLYAARMGPLGHLLPTLAPEERERIAAIARAALDPFVQGDRICFTAACWRVRAIA
ncbi:class I SAM-dependent methyltransferase [Massilia sp. METH4]|uniref:class I SAM-dependent methyltransferase n=1 Tax=Massilia sp. METH4 TaxID=3123041 RepID=UPI0030CD798D